MHADTAPPAETARHGTYLCYLNDGCRLEACRTAWRLYQRRHAAGQRLLVDAAPVIARLLELLDGGRTVMQIARDTGLTHGTIGWILRHRPERCRSTTADAVLDVAAPEPRTVTLDARPLLDAIDSLARRRQTPLTGLLDDEADRRAVYRARSTGRIAEPIADRIAIRAGLGPLPLIYDLDVLLEAA